MSIEYQKHFYTACRFFFIFEIVIKALVNLDGNLGAHVRSNIMSLDLFKAFD